MIVALPISSLAVEEMFVEKMVVAKMVVEKTDLGRWRMISVENDIDVRPRKRD